MQIESLSLTARTLYAELLELGLGAGVVEQVRPPRGSLVEKRVRGRRYLYYQSRDLDGHTRQAYLGPDSDETRGRVARLRERTTEAADDLAHLGARRYGGQGAEGSSSGPPGHQSVARRGP